jgi:hypothetical protein
MDKRTEDWLRRLRRVLRNVPPGVAIAFSQDLHTYVRVLDMTEALTRDSNDGWHRWHHEQDDDEGVVLLEVVVGCPSDVGAP